MSYALWPVIFIYSSLRIFSWKMRMYWHAFVVSCIFVLYKKTCMYIKKIVYVTAENPKKKKEKNIKRCPSDQDWTNHVSIRCQSKNSSSLGWNFGLARAAGFLFFFCFNRKTSAPWVSTALIWLVSVSTKHAPSWYIFQKNGIYHVQKAVRYIIKPSLMLHNTANYIAIRSQSSGLVCFQVYGVSCCMQPYKYTSKIGLHYHNPRTRNPRIQRRRERVSCLERGK